MLLNKLGNIVMLLLLIFFIFLFFFNLQKSIDTGGGLRVLMFLLTW